MWEAMVVSLSPSCREESGMKVVKVDRNDIPGDWTEEHLRILEHGHEARVVANAACDGTAQKVLGFTSRHGVGITVFGGMTFVDVSPGGSGPARFEVVG